MCIEKRGVFGGGFLPVTAAVWLILCAAALFAAACEDTQGEPHENLSDPAVVRRVTVMPDPVDIVRGGEPQQFTAVVEGIDGVTVSQAVTWSIVQRNVNAGTTIDASGLLTVAAAETATVITVRAHSVQNSEKSAGATVNIGDQPVVSSVEVSPETNSAAAGFPCRFAALVTITGIGSKNVEWSIAEDHLPGTTIVNGLFTVDPAEPLGTVTVKAVSVIDREKSGTATVGIIENSPLPSLAGTCWWWPSLQMFFLSDEIVMLYSTGAYYPYAGFPFPYTYFASGYAYSYTYDPATKRGAVSDLGQYQGGNLGSFTINAGSQLLNFDNYKNYSHGADFTTVRPEPSGGFRFGALPANLNGTIWQSTLSDRQFGAYTGYLVILHINGSTAYVTRTYVNSEAERERVFTCTVTGDTGTISGNIGAFTVNRQTNTLTFSAFPGAGAGGSTGPLVFSRMQ